MIPPLSAEALALRERLRNGIKWNAYPADVIPTWVADMDLPAAEPIRTALADASLRSDLGYARALDPRDPILPEVVVKRMGQRYGWSIAPDQVEIVLDILQGLYIAVTQLTEPGDAIAVLTPSYPPLIECPPELGRTLVDVPLAVSEWGYSLDPARLPERAKLLLLCNPHNPTGRVFTRNELQAIADWALRTGCLVIADEIHQDLVYPGAGHIPFATLGDDIARQTITMTSPTKAFNVAGVGCAAVIFGTPELKAAFNRFPLRIRGHLPTLSSLMMQIAWTDPACDRWLADTLRLLESNRNLLIDWIAAHPPLRAFRPESTYLAWCDCRELDLPTAPETHFLERARVACYRGPFFGPSGQGFVRINFATPENVLREMLDRLERALDFRGRDSLEA